MILSINNKNDNALPSRAGHRDLHLPDRVSYLPRAILIVIPCGRQEDVKVFIKKRGGNGIKFTRLGRCTVDYLLAPDKDNFLSKALVFHCFLVFRRIGEYISLDLFRFVNITSSCLLIPLFDQQHRT